MNWIYIAITSYLFTAVANVLDKLVLSRFLKAPSIYAFYVGLLQIIVVVLIPFGVIYPGFGQALFAMGSGALFVAALFWMYKGFLHGETTRVATLIGGSLPIYTFLISFLFLGQRLAVNQLWAFLFLLLGVLMISSEVVIRIFKGERSKTYVGMALFAGLLFSLTFIGSDLVYDQQEFISGFFWLRIGSVIAALLILFNPKWRGEIFGDLKVPKKDQARSKIMVLGNQIIGATGFILLNLAIDLGPVVLENALQGLQYIFIFILAAVLGHWIKEVKEDTTPRIIFEKVLAIIFIATGLGFLAL